MRTLGVYFLACIRSQHTAILELHNHPSLTQALKASEWNTMTYEWCMMSEHADTTVFAVVGSCIECAVQSVPWVLQRDPRSSTMESASTSQLHCSRRWQMLIFLFFYQPAQVLQLKMIYLKWFITKILLKQSYRSSNTVKVEVFFSQKIFSAFDWIQIIVAVAGALTKTMEISHNIGQIPF